MAKGKFLIAGLVTALILFGLVFKLSEQKIYVVAEVDDSQEIIACADAQKGTSLVTSFIHSVQKTPVIDELEFDGEDFILRRTKYQSHGVGQPFLESDGDFHEENGFFVIDNMNRRIKRLELRVGTGTQLCITLDGQEHKLYEKFPSGTRIMIKSAPLIKILLTNF